MASQLSPNEATHTRVRDAVSCWLPVIIVVAILGAILGPVIESVRFASLSEVFMTHTKVLRMAIDEYCADNDDRFPMSMDSALDMKPAIGSYLVRMMQADDVRVYRSSNPVNQEILANWHLAGRARSSVAKPEEVALFYDSAAWPGDGWLGGKRQVCMLNGHFSTFPDTEVVDTIRNHGGVFPLKKSPTGR